MVRRLTLLALLGLCLAAGGVPGAAQTPETSKQEPTGQPTSPARPTDNGSVDPFDDIDRAQDDTTGNTLENGDARPVPLIETPPARDPQVERVQARAATSASQDPLGPAKERPGGVPGGAAEGPVGDPYMLTPDRLPTGPNSVGVTVEVRAPEVTNLHVDNVFWVIVKNTTNSDATGVVVRYPLPETLEFSQSDPAPSRADGHFFYWQLNTLAAGAEKVIKVKVKPTAKGPLEHAVTVTLMTGGRARTVVREPMLKVDVRADKAKPLKGVPVYFDVNVSNIGDHPARDVVVQARLTAGLKHPKGAELVRPLKEDPGIDALAPGQNVSLKLEVDTTAMGVQACDIAVTSPDIPGEATAKAEVEVVDPDLQLVIEGPGERYPDNVATYRVIVTNAGTASARQVKVAAQIPVTGRPEKRVPQGRWVAEARTFYWSIAELPPNATETFTVQVRMGGVGLFTLKAGVQAQGIAPLIKSHNTDIQGISKLALSVSEPRGVLDEGEESEYEIKIRNEGSKEATNLQVRGQVSDNLEVLSINGPESRGSSSASGADPTTALFPEVARLPAGGEITMSFKVRAVKPGAGTCTVNVSHADIPQPLSQTMVTRVTSASGGVRR